jgi:hypothetical protein
MKKFVCKAILNQNNSTNTGIDWATSKRTILNLDDKSLTAANSKVLYTNILKAKLRIVPSAFFMPGCILTVTTDKTTHHFGLRYGSYWKGELPFPVEREKVNVSGIWIRRLIILGILGYILYSIIIKS